MTFYLSLLYLWESFGNLANVFLTSGKCSHPCLWLICGLYDYCNLFRTFPSSGLLMYEISQGFSKKMNH